MNDHPQVWVKVNAQVDQGVSGVVSALSSVEGLETAASCQGEQGGVLAYVYFYYGDWLSLGAFLFERLAPKLADAGEDIRLSMAVFGGSAPRGEIRYHPGATGRLLAALSSVQDRP